MKILLNRIAKKPTYTIGRLFIDDIYFCDTLEDKDRGLKDSMSEQEITKIKIKDKTAIPTGTYNITITYSNRFKKLMPLINNVKGFSGIRIHAGNDENATSGCILCGENKVVGKVINSRIWTNKLYDKIRLALNKKENVTITIQ